jgi:hypothetical protein
LTKSYADQLAAIGQPVTDEDLLSYVMSGLNPSFNSFVTVIMISTQKAPMTFADFRDELLNHELLLNQQTAPAATSTFALTAQKPADPPSGYPSGSSGYHSGPRPFRPHYPQRYSPRFHGRPPMGMSPNPRPQRSLSPRPAANSGPPFSGNSGPPFGSFPSRPLCQICGKTSHQALDYFHRMDHAYQGHHHPPQLAAMVAQHNTTLGDPQWFSDSGANAHITNDIENL